MFIISNDPGLWQYYHHRQDNVGLNIGQLKQKYLTEQRLFEQQQYEAYTNWLQVQGKGTISTLVPVPLTLGWDDITNADLLVGDASNVEDWNTFFDLPTNGTPFISVTVVGNDVNLFGGTDINLKDSLLESNQNLLSVVDSANCITTAGDGCFLNCNFVTSFNLPALTTAGDGCFNGGYAVTSFNLPVLTTAGFGCFAGCSSSTSFNLPVLTTAGDSCFAGCSSSTSFNLPALTTADDFCFDGCASVTSFNLPALTTAGDFCFSGCASVTSFNLPALTTAGDFCFSGCFSTTSFNLPVLTTAGDVCFEFCDATTSFNLPALTTAGDFCFDGCASVTSFNLPSCTNLGGTVGDNSVFSNIAFNIITLTVPSALMTCNSGNPDGDIEYLQANNTVTVITV